MDEPTRIPDESLITAFRNGDQSALTTLVEQYIDLVYNFVYRFVHSSAEAEDITQETFIKVWKAISTYRSGASFKAWILQIARNSALDYVRKKKMPVISAFDTDDGNNVLLETTADDTLSSLEAAISKEDTILLENAIAQLAPVYREVVILRYQEELTFEAIGEVLGRPLNTVKSQSRRALEMLRVILTAEDAPK